MKAYTDLNQSEKLVEILPLESADMYYEPSAGFCTEPSEVKFGDIKYAHPRSIRCWSLAALLRELPDTMLGKDKDGYVVMVETMGSGQTTFASNPIDACYEMIIKLHELKML